MFCMTELHSLISFFSTIVLLGISVSPNITMMERTSLFSNIAQVVVYVAVGGQFVELTDEPLDW
jgi:threonine/homoserine/homoserine lactone efflux protein